MTLVLRPLVKPAELRQAYRTYAQRLRAAATKRYTKTVGWPGGSDTFKNVYHCESHGFWFLFQDAVSDSKERHWCAFGTGSIDLPMLSITVEINPPTRGIYRRTAGLFLRDGQGKVFLAHSGKVGGGKKGVGKTAFLKSYRGPRVEVLWPDGNRSKALLISALDSNLLATNIGNFVEKVRRFKAAHSTRMTEPTENELATAGFTPEFSGSYVATISRSPQVRKRHGKVVNALAQRLDEMGYRIANDRHRDLIVAGRGKTVKVLFEAKTGVGLTDIYTGVGQLLVHGSVKPHPRRLVLVLPKKPRKSTAVALDSLNIAVLLYTLRGNVVAFRNLDVVTSA